MKRRITASTSRQTSPAIAEFIEEIGGLFHNSGYDITGYGTQASGIILEATYRENDSDKMPTIKLDASISDNRIYVDSELSFPVLLSVEGTSFSSTHHWLAEWEKIGRYLTKLHEHVFYLDNE